MKKRIVTAVKQRFSIRKLSIGAASVLLGTSLYFMGVSAPVVHADTIDEPAASSEKTDSSDPVSVANDSKYSDVDVNNAIDQYAEDVKTKLENNGNKVIIRPSDKQPVTVNTTKDRADQVNNIKQKIDQANQSWDAINTCKKSNNKQIKDGKDSDYFENQSLSVDDEKKSEINQITVDGKGTTLLKGQSKNIDGIDIIHTTHMTDKEREAMKVNSNNKVIVNFQPDQCSNKEITVTYNNLKNSYYLENINDETSRIKISRIDRTFSSIQAAENPKLFYGGWRGNKYDNYDPCNGPQLIIYNDPSDGFFYNNIQQISVKDTYYYDDKGEQKQIIFDTKDPAWVFVTSLNSNGGGNIEKIRALDSNDSPLSAQKIAGSTVTDHNDGWYYSDNNNNFSNANNIFGQKLDWDNNDEYNRFGFVGTAAFQYQPGMTLQYRSDDSQWGSHWACMQTQVVSSLNENVIICGHIKDETEGVAGNDTVTRTIHYLYDNGKTAKSDKTQTVSFNVTGIKDDVTGKTTWDGDAQAVDPVTTPSITGYTPDKLSIEGQDFKFGDKDVEVTVTYTANTQTAKINYIDDTTKTKLDSKDTSGKFGQTITFATAPADEIENYKKQGYVFVSNNFDNQTYQAVDSNNVFEVHFKHGIVTVTTKNPQIPNTTIDPDPHSPKYPKDISNTNSDVKRTIDYNFKDGKTAQPTVTDNLHFERTVVIDKVTGKVLSDTWTQSQNFSDIQTPAIQGYTPDRTAVSDKNIGHDHNDIVEHVVYSPDAQHMTITYIDDTTGKTLHTDTPNDGVSDQDANYTTSDAIKKYEGQHYKLVSDSTKGQDLIFDHDDNVDQSYEVHFVHDTHSVDDQTTKSEVIHYVYADGLARQGKVTDDNVQQLSFTRDGYHDEVTGTDHWNAWKPAQQEFVSVKSPEIQGYTADQANIPAIKVNSDSDNIERTVTYKANKQTLNVTFIDDTTGKTLLTVIKEGVSDSSANYNTANDLDHYKSLHFNVISDGTQGQNLVFDHDDGNDQHYEVHLSHATHAINEAHDVSQVIHYVYQNGSKAGDDYTNHVHFARDGYHDEVTNEDHWNAWKPAQQEFVSVKSPKIQGFTPDNQTINQTTVTPSSQNIEQTVTYHGDIQFAHVKYIDDSDNGRVMNSDDLNGHTGETDSYTTAKNIKNYTNQGYVFVSDNYPATGVVFDNNDLVDQYFEVHFKHGTITVTPEQPGKPVEPINTGDPTGSKYPNRTDAQSLQTDVTRTIDYVYQNGKHAQSSVNDSLHFVETKVIDKVTGKVLSDTWSPAQDFETKITPTIDGYTPDRQTVSNTGINHDHPAIHEVVTYNPDAQKAVVKYIDDTDQKQLSAEDLTGHSNEDSGYNTQATIDKYLADHYVLVSDDTHEQNVIYDHDDNNDQVYEVHFKHGTETASESRTKNLTVHYIYADGLARSGKTSEDQKAQSLTFKRTGTKDLVTNNIAWNAWDHDGQAFDEIKSPAIDGYTPDQTAIKDVQVDADGLELTEKTVVYNADSQKLMVNFIDDTTGKTLEIINKVGKSDEIANYDTKSDISKYIDQHYDLVSDGTQGQNLVFDHDDSKDQHYDVHLRHATHQINDQTATKQTIHYQLADGTKVFDDYTAEIDFSRDGYNDEVTNEDHWNKWSPRDIQTFSNVVSPVKSGYTPDQASVAVVDVHPGDKDIEETVIYSPDMQVMTINYIDDVTGKTLSTKQIIGVSDASANYNTKSSINSYVAGHYKLVSDNTNSNNLVFDHDDSINQVYNVHLTHTYQKVDDHKSVNETVHYIYDSGQTAHPDYKAPAINFSRTGTQDLVTNDIVWNAWTPDEQSFAQVTTPAINGYTPDVEVVPSVNVSHGSDDVERTVVYHADDQTILVNYIDDDTHSTLKTDTVIGKTAQKSNYTTKKSIDGYIVDHYELVSDDTNAHELVFDSDSTKAQVYSVHLKHAHQNVSDSASVNETIHYTYADGSKARDDYHAPAISFKRTGDKDLVTNTIVWNAWIPASQDFNAVNSPVIAGYTPSQKTISNITVKPGDNDIDQTVVYAPDTQSIVVNYIDDSTGKTLATDPLTGSSNMHTQYSTRDHINGYEDQHYVLVSDDTHGETLTFDHADNATQVYTVHLRHQTEPTSQSRTVHEAIHYVYADGSKAADTVTATPLTFTQTGVKDLVTGDIDWNGTWTSDQTFAEVKSPEITGYTASRKVVDPITVDHNSSDIYQTVIYTANDQTAKIKYIDDVTGKTLETDSANGKFGDQINFGHDVDMQIKAFEGQGYKFTSNSFNGQKYQADNSQNEFEVHFAHGTQNVSRTNKVMETIKYQFADGRQAQKDRVQTAKFTQHGVQDLVTKTTVWTPSDPQNFESVTTPELEGYTPDVQTVQAVTVNFGNRDITKVVTYKANDQLAGIKYIDDTTGKTLDTEAASGKFSTRIEFMHDPSSMIQKFESQGYRLISNSFNGQKYQADNSQNEFEVHFTHDTQNVVRTDKVTETVKYQFTDGRQAQKAHVQTVEFIQHGVQDLATKTIVWTPSDPQNFENVTTPELEGYTPDIQNVPAATVNFDDSDSTKVVTYKANAQLAGIKYIDDTTGKILDTEAASGNFGTKIEFMDDPLSMIQKFEDQGYKLVSDTFKGQAYQADNSENQFNVHFKHVEKNVSRTSTVTRTIKYVGQKTGKEIHQPVIQTLTFTENGVTDLVTGETTWTVPSDQIFNEIESPKIDGYENPDISVVDAKTAKFGDDDQTVIVNYRKVDGASASYTPKTTRHSKTSNSLNTSVTTTNTTRKATQNISIRTSQTSTQQDTNNHHARQLPQTGTKSDSELELLGFIGIAVAGLFGFGTHRKKRD